MDLIFINTQIEVFWLIACSCYI